MLEICSEDECNDTYGRMRMHQTLKLKQPDGVNLPSERTVYRVMEEIGISHRPKRKPNEITKTDKPLEKCVTDMTEVKCLDSKLYVSAIFDCLDCAVLGLAMDTNMKATLYEKHWKTLIKHPRKFVDVSCSQTGAHSIPVNFIATQ